MSTQPIPESQIAANLQWFLGTESDPKLQFEAIDREVRRIERIVNDWPSLARMCKAVEAGKLWKHGEYSSFTNWLQTAAPKCERSIREYMATNANLSPDFTDEEQAEMPVETAKFIAKSVPSKEHRKNPAVKAASKKDKAECVQAVKAAVPELHLEDLRNVAFTESAWECTIQPAIDRFKLVEDEPEMPTAQAIEVMLDDYWKVRDRLSRMEAEAAK